MTGAAFPGTGDPPVEVLRASLEHNQRTMGVPTTRDLWREAWLPMNRLLGVLPLVLAGAYLIAGPVATGIGALLQLAALYHCYRLTGQVALAPSAWRNAMLNGGMDAGHDVPVFRLAGRSRQRRGPSPARPLGRMG